MPSAAEMHSDHSIQTDVQLPTNPHLGANGHALSHQCPDAPAGGERAFGRREHLVVGKRFARSEHATPDDGKWRDPTNPSVTTPSSAKKTVPAANSAADAGRSWPAAGRTPGAATNAIAMLTNIIKRGGFHPVMSSPTRRHLLSHRLRRG